MNFDYIRMISYVEIKNFITSLLTRKFNTNLVVKLVNIKTDARSHQVEFEVISTNGFYLKGCAICTDFGCEILLNDNKKQTKINCNKEWAKWVYAILKSKDVSYNTRKGELYKADYNEHCQKIRDSKRAEAEKECEANLLK